MTGDGVTLPKIVSLFSGAGGLDLGFRDAGFEVVFALDNSAAAIRTHERNFAGTTAVASDLIELGADGVIEELASLIDDDEEIGVIGGPPCQGFSRANNASVATDPRNTLPILYLEVVEALQAKYKVRFVMFENVLGLRDIKHRAMYDRILNKFRALGLKENVDEYRALEFGVPQDRRRLIISAFDSAAALQAFSPIKVDGKQLNVREAIGDLPMPTYFRKGIKPEEIEFHPNHWTMRPLSKKFSDPKRTSEGQRSFRRLSWDKPSPTVAYGNREIHVHPSGTRRLSIYEAMQLQGFPEEFVLEGTLSEQVNQVSNAVPPPLARALADAVAISMATTLEAV